MAQENLITASGIPYTIVRSTQFFEFTGAIAQSGTVGQAVHVSPALFQPIASDDVADALADAALGAPVRQTPTHGFCHDMYACIQPLLGRCPVAACR